MRKFLIVVPLLLVANLAVSGSSSDRTIAALLVLMGGVVIAVEFWASRHPEQIVSRVLYSPRLVSLRKVVLIGVALLGMYVGIIAAANELSVLDDAIVLTIAFFTMFLGFIAIAAVIDRGIQLLRRKRGAG